MSNKSRPDPNSPVKGDITNTGHSFDTAHKLITKMAFLLESIGLGISAMRHGHVPSCACQINIVVMVLVMRVIETDLDRRMDPGLSGVPPFSPVTKNGPVLISFYPPSINKLELDLMQTVYFNCTRCNVKGGR